MRLDDVWLRYRRRAPWVLQGVTATLRPGEAATVTGRNGAGKSTLLKLVAGLLRAERGTVQERPSRVGYVPERFPADQPFTARRYLTMMAAINGRSVAQGRASIGHWADRLQMTNLLDVPLPELSKGSAQKVGLIQAMLTEPELLVLDEPWEGLDQQTCDQVPLIIEEVVGAGGSVLVSDHVGHSADLPGMRRWELSGGQVTEAASGPSSECVVEVAVRAPEVPAAVASLRAAGHRVVNVRVRREGARSW